MKKTTQQHFTVSVHLKSGFLKEVAFDDSGCDFLKGVDFDGSGCGFLKGVAFDGSGCGFIIGTTVLHLPAF